MLLREKEIGWSSFQILEERKKGRRSGISAKASSLDSGDLCTMVEESSTQLWVQF